MCRRLNSSLIKQMLILYVVCLLFYAIGGFLFICLSPFPEYLKAPLGEGRFISLSIGGTPYSIKRLLFHSIVLLFLIEYQFDVVALLFAALLKQDYSQHFF